MQKQTAMAVFGMALALTIPVSAQTPEGTIRVHVTVPETQAPIPGVQLSLFAASLDLPDNESGLLEYLTALAASRGLLPGNPASPVSPVADPSILARAVTDSQGNAIFPGLKPGKYRLRATREGYVAPVPSTFSSASVEVAGSATDVSLYLNPGATISGRILTADGNGVSGANVALGTIQRVSGQRTFVPGIAAALTDTSGEYRLPLVGPGEYAIRVQASRTSAVFTFYPGTADLQKATILLIEAPPRNLIRAGWNIVNVDVVLP